MPSMSSLVPPAYTTYPGGYNTIPLQTNIRPNNPIIPNNEAYVPLQFDWSILYANNNPNTVSLCYLANVGLAPNALDYIRCLVIDNSYCEYDIHIQFLDGFTLTIPAWEPLDVYPVITNQKAFYVWCESLSPINVIGGPPIIGRHSTTNIFVCNANVPPIRAKKTDKEYFLEGAFTSPGTYSFSLGIGNSSPLSSGGLLKKIIVNNMSNMGAGAIITSTISIENNTFVEPVWFQPGNTNNFSSINPFILDNLNIRCLTLGLVFVTVGTVVMNVAVTVVYVDHSGFSVLT